MYFDYSATTKPRKEVLDTYNKVNEKYWYNSNALYNPGREVYNLIDTATFNIANILSVKKSEIIYTGSASEANNQAIISYALKYQNRGKEIITTPYEHASVIESLKYLEKNGFTIKEIPFKGDNLDLDKFKEMINDQTILVTTSFVSSEIGIITEVNKIANIIKKYPKCKYHVDAVQSLCKINMDLTNIDMATFSFHKIFGLKGIGILYKKENLEIDSLIKGGESYTKYRSGTSDAALIASFAKGLKLEHIDLEIKYNYVKQINIDLRLYLQEFDNIVINSSEKASPYILNISFLGQKGEVIQRMFANYEIYLSTKSSCSSKEEYSSSLYKYKNDKDIAVSSIRISLSYQTTAEEVEKLKIVIKDIYYDLYK